MQYQFNAQQYEPSMGFDVWPDGWVPVILSAAEPRETNGEAGKGGQLGLSLQAIDGPLKGKQAYLGLNLWHPNQQTVEIAQRTLSAIVHVTLGANQNRFTFNDPTEMLNIPFLILAQRQKDNDQRNEFRQFRDIRGNDPKGAPPASPLKMAGAMLGAPHVPGAGGGPPGGFAPPPQGFAPPGAPPAFTPPGAPQGGPPPQGQPPYNAPAFQPPQGFTPPPAPAGFAPPQGQPQWQAPQGAPGGPPQGQPQWQQPGALAAPQQQPQPQWQPPGAPQGAPPGPPQQQQWQAPPQQGGQPQWAPPAGAPPAAPSWQRPA